MECLPRKATSAQLREFRGNIPSYLALDKCQECKKNSNRHAEKFDWMNDTHPFRPAPDPAGPEVDQATQALTPGLDELLALEPLTPTEEMLISRALPIMEIHRLKSGGYAFKGHVIAVKQDISHLASLLPRRVSDLRERVFVVVKRFRRNESGSQRPLEERSFRVRRNVVSEMLTWLLTYARGYRDVVCLNAAVDELPVDANVMNELICRQMERLLLNSSNASDTDSSSGDDEVLGPIENAVPDVIHSAIDPDTHAGRNEADLIRDAVIGTQHEPGSSANQAQWPQESQNPISEYNTPGLYAMCYPCPLPYGSGDVSDNSRRLVKVTEAEMGDHVMKYCVIIGGKPVWPVAEHCRLPYHMWNVIERHRHIGQAHVFMAHHPDLNGMTMDELQEIVRDPQRFRDIVCSMQKYSANCRGGPSYFAARREELLQANEQAGYATLYLTKTQADLHWPDLHSILQTEYPDGCDPLRQRSESALRLYHIADAYFVFRHEEFTKHFLKELIKTEWSWDRFEWQYRGG